MKQINHILQDIRQGENLDQYATILAALIVLIFSLFGSASDEVVAALTLAILALVSISLVAMRRRLDTLVATTQTPDGLLLEQFPVNLKNMIAASQELWIVGINMHSTLADIYPDLEDLLQKSIKVKVLLINPGVKHIKYPLKVCIQE